MGKKVVVGLAFIAGAVVLGIFGQWNLALAAASTGIGILTQPKPGDLGNRQGAILENRVSPLDRLPVIYGTTKIAGTFADFRLSPTSTSNKLLHAVMAFCHGSRDGSGVTAIDEVWFDDRQAIDGSTTLSPFNTARPAPTAGDHLEFAHYLGSTTQLVDSTMNNVFPTEWPDSSAGAGICYSRFSLWYNTDIYPGGLPNIQALIRGNKVYDPRDSTWKHSANPALCIRDYLLSTIYGVGIPEANLDDDSFIDAANYCDELVSIPAAPSTQPRYELNGWVDTARSVAQNLAELCSSCRGQIVNESDKWRLVIRQERTVSGFKITADNTVTGSWQFVLPGSDTVPNVGRAQYIDPARNYDVDVVQWPEAGLENLYLADDNSFENRLEIDLPFTTNRYTAQQIIMTLLKEARSGIGVICTLKESATVLQVGDLVEVTYDTPGWEDKVFDVLAFLHQPDGTARVVLSAYEVEVYDLDTQFEQVDVIDTSLPDPLTCLAPTSLILTNADQAMQTNDGRYIPRIRATWGVPDDPFIDFYEVQAKLAASSDVDWDSYGRIPATDDPLFFITPVTDEYWDVRIRAVNRIGVKSEWVEESIQVITDDPRPQILSVTLTRAHADTHIDIPHEDVAHGDAAHGDDHDDVAHEDSHLDMHLDSHADEHFDGHSDLHGDGDMHMDAHSDSHDDSHSDVTQSDHSDTAHTDTHTDDAHADSAHADSHTDSHGDGQHGLGVALQADKDSASMRAVARKHGDIAAVSHTDGAHTDTPHTDVTDPTEAEVRAESSYNGRNVVIELIDVATGEQLVLAPGDRVRIGALAYSEVDGEGVEGPLALASEGLFSVAPVGTDMYVPID